MKRLFAIIQLVIWCVVLLPSVVYAEGYDLPDGVSITAEEAYVINLDTGLVVYEKNADIPRSIASLTKLMTALLLMESVQDLENTMITAERGLFTGSIIQPGTSTADIQPGEQVSALNMLYAMMLPSGNEAAEAVGYYLSGGNMQNFYAMMNVRAKQLGCRNTNFASAHGLVDLEGGNYSTARDLALIAQECWKHEIFRTVCGTRMHWMPLTEHTRHNRPQYPKQNPSAAYYIQNTNLMLSPASGVYRSYIKGMKTGSTHAAGRSFVSAAVNERGESFIGVVLGCPWEPAEDGYAYSFHDTITLYDWIFSNFTVRPTLDTTQTITETRVKWSAETDRLRLVPADDLKTILPNGGEGLLETVFHVPEVVAAPIRARDHIGTVTIKLGDQEIGTVDLLAANNVRRSTFLFIMGKISEFFQGTYFKVVVVLSTLFVGGYVAFTIRSERLRRARLQKKQSAGSRRRQTRR